VELQTTHLVRHKACKDEHQNQGLHDDRGSDEAMWVVVSHVVKGWQELSITATVEEVACLIDIELKKTQHVHEIRTTKQHSVRETGADLLVL
jgi:hypothetical protein